MSGSTLIALVLLVVIGGLAALGVRAQRWRMREETVRALLATFAPAVPRALAEPHELLSWYAIARGARRLFPEAFAQLDRAMGEQFPFSSRHVQEAHARCTADWLAWERSHDLEYKLKAAALEEDLTRRGTESTSLGRGQLAAVEQEKLERYQARYAEYIKLAKALEALDKDRPEGTG